MTWVKALASPLSHEYIQFILLDPLNGSRCRLITDRQEDGDWVHIVGGPGWDASAIYSSPFPPQPPPPPPTSFPHLNHHQPAANDVKDGNENASYDAFGHHTLPLPLLSLTFAPKAGRPTTLLDFAAIPAQVTAREPRYRLIREHCWWYAEAVFDAARMLGRQHQNSPFRSPTPATPTTIRESSPHLKEWDYAGYRYSFVVRLHTWKPLRRELLVKCARDFRARYMDDFTF